MTVKIVRIANGEDVIADVREAYPGQESFTPIGYLLTNPYQITITATAEMLFEQGTTDEPQRINDLNLELFPWIPLSVHNKTLVQLSQVTTIYDPHPEVLTKWVTLTERHHNESVESSNPEGSDASDGGSD
jgi:hypothetical protein